LRIPRTSGSSSTRRILGSRLGMRAGPGDEPRRGDERSGNSRAWDNKAGKIALHGFHGRAIQVPASSGDLSPLESRRIRWCEGPGQGAPANFWPLTETARGRRLDRFCPPASWQAGDAPDAITRGHQSMRTSGGSHRRHDGRSRLVRPRAGSRLRATRTAWWIATGHGSLCATRRRLRLGPPRCVRTLPASTVAIRRRERKSMRRGGPP